jgi:hypothetical protein
MHKAMTTMRIVFRVLIFNPNGLAGDDPQQDEKRDNRNQDQENDGNNAGRIPDKSHRKPS